jgi:isovaleryl-CoA dehydrogenase
VERDPIRLAESLVPQLAAAERDHDLAGRYAADNIRLIAEHGLLGLNVPVSHGGLGASLSGTVETLRTVAQGSPSTALMLTMHTSILAHYLLDPRHIPAEQRSFFEKQQAWAWKEASDGRIFGVANSEAGAGGDVKKTRAEIRHGRVHGTKTFCSGGLNADYFMASARNEEGSVEYYLLANEAGRVSVGAPWTGIGMRSSESVSLRFDGAPVLGPLALLGLLEGVNNRHWSTLSFTSIFVGIAESLLADAKSQPGGVLHRASTVDLHLTVQASRAFLRHCVATEPEPADAAYRKLVRDCKLYVTRSLAEKGMALFTAQGGSAYTMSSAIGRKLRDLLAGPALRPPVGVSFDELWEELAGSDV